jgi:hypothetical protein
VVSTVPVVPDQAGGQAGLLQPGVHRRQTASTAAIIRTDAALLPAATLTVRQQETAGCPVAGLMM